MKVEACQPSDYQKFSRQVRVSESGACENGFSKFSGRMSIQSGSSGTRIHVVIPTTKPVSRERTGAVMNRCKPQSDSFRELPYYRTYIGPGGSETDLRHTYHNLAVSRRDPEALVQKRASRKLARSVMISRLV
jgi:hypothetical protein